MQNSLREALYPVFTVEITGDQNNAKKLCLLPGIYSTIQFVQDPQTKAAVLTFDSPADLNNAGYSCDQVADDYEYNTSQVVQVKAIGRSKYRDFVNQASRVGMKCTNIMIKNLGQNETLFNQQVIELARTLVGASGGKDFITLQKYINPNAFDRSFINIDLSGLDERGEEKALWLTPEVFMAINVPAGSHFTMQFTFEGSASGLA